MQNIYYVQNGEKSRKPFLLADKYIRTKLKRSHSNRNLMKMPKEHEFQNYSHNFFQTVPIISRTFNEKKF